jgi:hypothetical protein
MITGALLTVLSILLAAYSMQPEEKRLDLKIRISLVDIFFILALIVAILTVVYSPVILNATAMEPIPWRWGFNAELAAFSYLLVIIIFSAWKMRSCRIPSMNYRLWAKESDLLLRGHKFSQLGYLLNKYHKQLFAVNNQDTWLLKLRMKIAPPVKYWRLILVASEERTEKDSGIQGRLVKLCHTVRTWIVKPIPTNSVKQDVIKSASAKLFKSRLFVTYLADTYPIIGAKATQLRFRDDDEYRKYYFEALISNPHSALHREIRDSQNIPVNGKYDIDPSNQILSYFFSDVNVAKEISAWQPVGEWTKAYIQRGERNEYYNQPSGYFSGSDERWECPIYLSSHYFNEMITSAICQRVNDHMWLMYIDRFIEDILNQIDRAADVDLDREFPAKYDYLLYHLFSICDDWLDLIEYLNFDNISPEETRGFPEHWAAKSFGSMLRKILLSEKLSQTQKSHFLEIAIKRIKKLDQNDHKYYSDLILGDCIREYPTSTIDPEIINELSKAFMGVDYMLNYGDYTFKSLMVRKGVEI